MRYEMSASCQLPIREKATERNPEQQCGNGITTTATIKQEISAQHGETTRRMSGWKTIAIIRTGLWRIFEQPCIRHIPAVTLIIPRAMAIGDFFAKGYKTSTQTNG